MSTETLSERLTYEEWRLLPETTQPYEVIDGVLRMSPTPTSDHQWIILNIYDILKPFVRSRRKGVLLVAPLDVVIQKQPLRTRQPDLLFLSIERSGVRGRKELREMPVIEVAPDLVAEVLSPSNTPRAMEEKIEDYRRLGVRECWIVSPEAETIEVLRLSEEGVQRVGVFGHGDTLRSEILPGLTFVVDEVFE